LGATFDEIDLEAATWSTDAARMKMGKPHDVPLSGQALAVLRRQHGRARRKSARVSGAADAGPVEYEPRNVAPAHGR
jgi:integrase